MSILSILYVFSKMLRLILLFLSFCSITGRQVFHDFFCMSQHMQQTLHDIRVRIKIVIILCTFFADLQQTGVFEYLDMVGYGPVERGVSSP